MNAEEHSKLALNKAERAGQEIACVVESFGPKSLQAFKMSQLYAYP
jgi:hypothetical protein